MLYVADPVSYLNISYIHPVLLNLVFYVTYKDHLFAYIAYDYQRQQSGLVLETGVPVFGRLDPSRISA